MPTNNSKSIVLILSVSLFLLLFNPLRLHGQTSPINLISSKSLQLERSLGIQAYSFDSIEAKTSQATDTTVVKVHQRSPLIAVLLSAVIPGGGQVYNKSYWKLPIIIGTQGFFVSQWISNNKTYEQYRSSYSNSITTSNPLGNQQLKLLRDSYRDQRDSYAWYIAGVYLLSMLDAYVDAELSGFDISPNLSMTSTSGAALALRLKF